MLTGSRSVVKLDVFLPHTAGAAQFFYSLAIKQLWMRQHLVKIASLVLANKTLIITLRTSQCGYVT